MARAISAVHLALAGEIWGKALTYHRAKKQAQAVADASDAGVPLAPYSILSPRSSLQGMQSDAVKPDEERTSCACSSGKKGRNPVVWNFAKVVIAAHRWLSQNYQDGDRIYLFGEPQDSTWFDDPEHERRHQGSPAVPTRSWVLVSQTTSASDFFRHALALDERRVKYLPEYAHGGVSEQSKRRVAQRNEDTKARRSADLTADEDKVKVKGKKTDIESSASHPRIKEVCQFPGTHSDIGGGNQLNLNLNLSKTFGLWMSYVQWPANAANQG
ncbi:hypothetical protein JB92DRAFT_2838851 [Gautieria morchelliformis]|nr:hypothetical protein JB92DRAFT_2838851 [Gautieria morchelliformis]